MASVDTSAADVNGLDDVTVVADVDVIGATSTADSAGTNGEAVVGDVTAVMDEPALIIKPLSGTAASALIADLESTSRSCSIATVTSAFASAAEFEICEGGRVPLTANKMTMKSLKCIL